MGLAVLGFIFHLVRRAEKKTDDEHKEENDLESGSGVTRQQSSNIDVVKPSAKPAESYDPFKD